MTNKDTWKELRIIPLAETKKCEGCLNSLPTPYNWYCKLVKCDPFYPYNW